MGSGVDKPDRGGSALQNVFEVPPMTMEFKNFKEKTVKAENKQVLLAARDANLLKQAIEVRDQFGSREQRRRNTILEVPEIETLRTYTQGNYTVVLLNGEYVGVSKRSKTDKYDYRTGLNKALYRAVRRLVLASR